MPVEPISTADARNQFSDIINRAAFGKERVILTRRGKQLVAVIPVEDLELLEAMEDRADIEAARKAIREGTTIPWEEVKAELKAGRSAKNSSAKSSRSRPAGK